MSHHALQNLYSTFASCGLRLVSNLLVAEDDLELLILSAWGLNSELC